MPRLRHIILGSLAILAPLSASSAAKDWYERGHGRAPAGNRVYICHGYSCRIVTPVHLSGEDIGQIAAPFSTQPADAEGERGAIAVSIRNFETLVGARVGTSGDLPKMQFGGGSDGQMDCIDEATNTTSLLKWLHEQGYVRHHTIREPAARGFFIDGRYPHATAVIAENGGGEAWAIDSWPNANGGPPLIQPLKQWFRSRSGGNSAS